MEPENLTLKVLIDIREEMRGSRIEQREMHEQTNARLTAIEHTVLDAATQIRVLARTARVSMEVTRAHEERFDALERRVAELERSRT
jgi:hypothetical protein